MKSKEKNISIQVESNQELNITLGKVKENLSQEQYGFGIEIVNNISNAIKNICTTTWINDYLEAIDDGNNDIAYNIFEEHNGLLIFSNNINDLENLRKLNYNLLEGTKKLNFLKSIIAFSSKLNVRNEELLNDIDILLNEFSSELDKDIIQNLRLEKANIFAKKEHFNTATSIYKKIISESDTNSGTLAWAYQGLSLIADNYDDIIYYAEKAQDKHLEYGNHVEAIKNIIKISDMKSDKDLTEAIKFLDLALSLNNKDSIINQELLASILFKKASYLNKIDDIKNAYNIIKQSCNLREGLLGNEIYYYSSLSLAYILAKANNKLKESEDFKNKQNEIIKYIKDQNFILRLEFGNYLEERKEIDSNLEIKIIDSGDYALISSLYLIKSLNVKLQKDQKLELLDKAILFAKNYDNELMSNIYFSIAEIYRNENDIIDALNNYKYSLNYNFYHHSAFQNCISMLIENKDWNNAEILIKERINRIGKLPNICYIYGKVLFEKGDYKKAYNYFKQANNKIKDLKEYKLKCIENLDDEELSQLDKKEIFNNKKEISINDLYKSLEDFSISISSDSRMHFWKYDKIKKGYKWATNPEDISKQFLIQFLNARFGKENIEVIQETRAGAGFIDLYILLAGGLKVIIELKMCGEGYSSSYAISGEDQIIHYQKNRNTKIGFLIVFDARKRDFSKGLKEIQTFQNHTIYSIAVDMRTNVK
ncbi:tetratricopeptide repeat protein [Aliarcobacter butzleri]